MSAKSYHHGRLREGLLEAAEKILIREGIEGLTLRAAAREAGVSHAAPKNHFGDLKGLLSDLASVGFERLRETMLTHVSDGASDQERITQTGYGYVQFARENPALFLLMFRNERLDFNRSPLKEASVAALEINTASYGLQDAATEQNEMSLPLAVEVTISWSVVHGLAMLLIDGRLDGVIGKLPEGADEKMLLDAVFMSLKG